MASTSAMLSSEAIVDSQGSKKGRLHCILWKGERRGCISGNNKETMTSREQNGTQEPLGQFSALLQSCWLSLGKSFRYVPHFFHLQTGFNGAAAECFDIFS